jgi:hypothetical protein
LKNSVQKAIETQRWRPLIEAVPITGQTQMRKRSFPMVARFLDVTNRKLLSDLWPEWSSWHAAVTNVTNAATKNQIILRSWKQVYYKLAIALLGVGCGFDPYPTH